MTRPSGDRWSSVGIRWATQTRSVASNTSERRLDAVSSGPKRRKFPVFARTMSRKNRPSTRVASLVAASRPSECSLSLFTLRRRREPTRWKPPVAGECVALSGEHARQALAILVQEGRLKATEVRKALQRRDRLIKALRPASALDV